MSQENVELVRRAYEAFNRGDLDGMVADFAPTFEYASTGAIPGAGGVYRGQDGMRQFLGWLWNDFESPRAEIGELIEAGDQVLAELTLRGRGKQSGVEAGWDVWQLWTVQDGKMVRGEGFTSREGAPRSRPAAEVARLRCQDRPRPSTACSCNRASVPELERASRAFDFYDPGIEWDATELARLS